MASLRKIVIKGAREHNLREVSLELPQGALICFTGVSGSGKSSLAFDTLYAEGQRRYVESLSSYARQFLCQLPKPDVDRIDGLSPAIAIQQKTGGRNPRSTVGTITEIHDFLRVLFARVGRGHCPECQKPIVAQTRDQMVARALELPTGTPFYVLAPVIRGQKGEYKDLFAELARAGFVRARVDGKLVSITEPIALERQTKHTIEVVIDRLKAGPAVRARLSEAIETALKHGEDTVVIAPEGSADLLLSAKYACPDCKISFESPSPQLFSFNSPQGMCPACDGLGELRQFDPDLLVPDPSLSVFNGAIEPFGPIKSMGKWKQHIYRGIAENLEGGKSGPPPGTLLETPWRDLPKRWRDVWLYGTGQQRLVFRWKTKGQNFTHAEVFSGIANELTAKYREAKGGPMVAALEKYMRFQTCPQCQGARLNPRARSVRVGGLSLPQIEALSIAEVTRFLDLLAGKTPTGTATAAKAKGAGSAETLNPEPPLSAMERMIGEELLKEIRTRLKFLNDVGLDYLSLDRSAPTLSGGEAQRIRLASQVGAGLVGVLYILDEPSIGLHPRDNDRLIASLLRLRDQGNTVVVVEHDEDTMRASDMVVDFGPGPGIKGGEIIASGTCSEVAANRKSVTGNYLSGRLSIEIPAVRKPPGDRWVKVINARHHNLRGVDVAFPLGLTIAVTGVSGSGKSSLVNEILRDVLARELMGALTEPGKHDRIEGMDLLDKIIDIDQSPIGRTPRSNPATYTKLFDLIRDLYTKMPDAKTRGYLPGRFSFNVEGGRCEACHGNGSNRLEMDFLADVWVTCPVCNGHRFNHETLHVRFKGKSISDVLEMDVQEALEHFSSVPKIAALLSTLHDVGLDYIKLGQPSPTLSGGEAQRIKLARELAKRGTGKTLYVLDEPTTGLHFEDIRKLLGVMQGFTAAGNTVIVIEHNLDVIKTADWIIDMGPEGGAGGGRIVAEGTPEQIMKVKGSYTGQALKKVMSASSKTSAVMPTRDLVASTATSKSKGRTTPALEAIEIVGARQHNLKGVDMTIPREKMTVCSGPSGSGKSSLAMDTLYAEGQRRYVESLSSYARQFLAPLQKPRVDQITGLSPAISIEQKTTSKSPRSTVGTVTEIYDYLRILFARLGQGHCPKCGIPVGTQTADEVVEKILHLEEGTKIYLMAPIERKEGQSFSELWAELQASGFARVRVDGVSQRLDAIPELSDQRKHRIEVVVDRAVVRRATRSRLADAVESALDLGKGVLHVARVGPEDQEASWKVDRYSRHRSCERCHRSFDELTPHHFSFNSAIGWCPVCQGLGTQKGANPVELIPDGTKTLREGAVACWPELEFVPIFTSMLTTMGVPLDTPFHELDELQQRLILHGRPDHWYNMPEEDGRPGFGFQFKGLFSAIEEAGRVSYVYRYQLQDLVDDVPCVSCAGGRLRDEAAAVQFHGFTMDAICRWPLFQTHQFFQTLKLDRDARHIAGDLIREIKERLRFLVDVGLDYLSLSRGTPTLSGGESQRIRLASQIGSGLTGVLYVLDEPTIGLHPRDNERLLNALKRLRDLGNTLVVVEHDREVIRNADYVFDFGPGSGTLGGEITAHGTPAKLESNKKSLTGRYLSGALAIPIASNRRLPGAEFVTVKGARHHNLKSIDVSFPVGLVTVVTGVSGSGKSTLVEDILAKSLAKALHRAKVSPGEHDAVIGLKFINKVISVDQTPIGNTPSSNPATYSGVFDQIRELFSKTPLARMRGYTPRRFSFNQAGGRCEACEGVGQKRIEMHFLPDVWVECEFCRGTRYSSDTLEVKFANHSIADVLDMTVNSALEVFEDIPKITKVLKTLQDVGLGYVRLGQSATTLSGGEAQRVKLSAELARPDTGKTFYILDEPTTGLHMHDVQKLLEVIHRLADVGNTVVVIEHNLDVIKTADWIIDMGPEAGDAGGRVVAEGPPEAIVKAKGSLTGSILRSVLAAGPYQERIPFDPVAAARVELELRKAKRLAAQSKTQTASSETETEINADASAPVSPPWEIDGRRWHTRDRVSRTGRTPRWDGELLAKVVDRVFELGKNQLPAADWSDRVVVRLGSFLKAMTSHEWVLTFKFLVPKNTFQLKELSAQLGLVPFAEVRPPVLSEVERIVINPVTPTTQEILVHAHNAEECATPGFDAFLVKAVAAYLGMARQDAGFVLQTMSQMIRDADPHVDENDRVKIQNKNKIQDKIKEKIKEKGNKNK